MSVQQPRGESYAQWVRQVVRGARRGGDVVSLFDSSIAEPTALLRETIARAFTPAISSRYVSAFSGNPFVIDHLASRYDVPREQVLCTTGATGGLSLLYRALLRPGDHLLVETPGFDLFTELAEARGAEVGTFARRPANGYRPDLAELAAAIRPDTRLIVLSDLHNPSGLALGEAMLRGLAELAEAHRLHVIVDEVYGDYADLEVRPRAAASYSPRLISLSSLTKIYGLSTLRCGWIIAAPEVMAPVRDVSEREEFGISNLSHAVAALVLEQEAEYRAHTDTVLRRARPVMKVRLAAWRAAGLVEGEMPEFACICFPRLPGIADTRGFAEWLSAETGVIVAPGEFFGAAGHVRIGFARPPAVLERGLDALEQAIRLFRDTDTPPAPRLARQR